jgi:DNA polymerase elongation subunit (family B)
MSKPKILIFDIETSPNLAHVWSFWNTNVGMSQIIEDGWMLSYAAKWLGEDEIIYKENRKKTNYRKFIKGLWDLINEADIVVAHNGKKFDLGWLRGQAAILRLAPPSPVKVVDTLLIARKIFYFPSYKLEYLTRVFQVSGKLKHKNFPGHELWVECLKENDLAWKEMKEYNIMDIVSLEELYMVMLPWIPNHPNLGVMVENEVSVCPNCGSPDHLQKRGFSYTNVSKFQRYACEKTTGGCGHWSRGRFNQYDKSKAKELLVHAL